ncbi:MAG: formylglycine-generating enzyme family protein [Anaerolineae bacterium]|nr:formylglycine-generating enzyme family protein [Anaerolineae bacterium]
MGIEIPVRRRTRDASWLWLITGMVLGVGCSAVVCLSAYVMNIVEIGDIDSTAGGEEAVVVTNTSEPSATYTATTVETEVTETAANVTPTASVPTFTPTALPSVGATPLPGGNGQGGSGEDVPPVDASAEATPVTPQAGATRTPRGVGPEAVVPDALLSSATTLVSIPGGTFTMGTTAEEGEAAVQACIDRDGGTCTTAMVSDSTPPHSVSLDNFQIEIYEVSVRQYVNFLNYLLQQNPESRPDKSGCGGPCVLTRDVEPNSYIEFDAANQTYSVAGAEFLIDHPVIYVTWSGADAYCRAIGRRLPTEAEWERAARGPANSIYPWGPEWIPANAKTSRPTQDGTMPVTSYTQGISAYGVYNMAGNVSEWVADFYQENYYTLPEAAGPNPKGPISGLERVARGGGWDNVPIFARTVHRMNVKPNEPRASLGFRCAADTQ